MKIQLIVPPHDYGNTIYFHSPHLGLISIANYVKKFYPEIKIEIIDLNITPLSETEIKEKLNSDIVGVTSYSYNYRNALKICKIANEKKIKVSIGGFHATYLPEEIHKNRPYIDYIIKGAGEKPFKEIIDNPDKRGIFDGTIDWSMENTTVWSEYLDEYGVDFKKYWYTYKNYLPEENGYKKLYSKFSLLMPYISHLGCGWKNLGKKCIFCSIWMPYLSHKSSSEFWEEIDNLHSKYQFDLIRDYGDDFLGDLNWVKELVRSKPDNLPYTFNGTTRINWITNESVKLLNQLNFRLLTTGLESGTDEILKRFNKGITTKVILKSIKILADNGVYLVPSFVIGCEGETDDTIKKTFSFISEKLSTLGNVSHIQILLLLPLPGSEAYQKLLLVEEVKKEISNKDILDLHYLQKAWFKHFCKIDFEKANAMVEKFQKDFFPYTSFDRWCK